MHAGLTRVGAAVASLLVLGAGCQGSPPADSPDPAAPSEVELFSTSDVPRGSSGTLVAGYDGDMVVCRGWGLSDRETKTAADCDTVYDVMSMTKQFTAAAVLKLQMMGGLRVSDPIDRYLHGVPVDKREITLQQLLTHTSGLVDALGDDYQPLSRADLLEQAFASPLQSRPGERYHYSNVGYSVLAAIIEVVSGEGYETFLAREVFAPAGMTRTGYVLPDWQPSDVAVEYDEHGRPQGRPFEHPWAADGPYWNLRGNGGLLSTARDMFRWYDALQSDRVLDDEARAELFRPRVLEGPHADTRYAYGWVVVDTPNGQAQWHNGGNGWSYGEILRLPEGEGFVFWVTNHSRSRAGGWNLDRSGPELTMTVAERLQDAL